jgi:hypothetical protein
MQKTAFKELFLLNICYWNVDSWRQTVVGRSTYIQQARGSHNLSLSTIMIFYDLSLSTITISYNLSFSTITIFYNLPLSAIYYFL